jgi:hypothetical protein
VTDRDRKGATAHPLIDWLLAVIAPAIVVGLIFLLPFLRDLSQVPYGADAFGYEWRTDLVYEGGIGRLTPEVVGQTKTLGERPAHPITLSVLRSHTGSDSLSVMRFLPALLAAAIALASAALAADAARERRFLSGIVGIGVGASVYVAYTAKGYSSNLAFDVMALAAGALAVRVATGSRRREIAGLAVLLAGGALYHWIFAAIFAALLVIMSGLLAGVRARRNGGGSARISRSAVRVVIGVGLACLFAAVLFLVFAPELPGRLPDISRTGAHAVNSTATRLPRMLLPLTLPLAGLGAVAIAADRDRRRRSSIALLVPWAMVAVVGVVAWYVLDLPSPPYRWAGFALGIPMLIVLGFLSIPRRRQTRTAVVAGVALAVLAAGGLSAAGASVWWNLDSRFDGSLVAALRTVRTYVDKLPSDTSIVLPVGVGSRPNSPVRAGLGASTFRRVVFVRARHKDLSELVPGPSAVLYVSALNRRPPEVPGVALGDGVLLLHGPQLDVEPAPIPRAQGRLALLGLTAACLIALALAGTGWSLALTDLPVIGAMSVAPAFGLAGLGIIGLVGSRMGVPLHGVGGICVLLITALGGGLLAVAMHRGRGPDVAPGSGRSWSGRRSSSPRVPYR